MMMCPPLRASAWRSDQPTKEQAIAGRPKRPGRGNPRGRNRRKGNNYGQRKKKDDDRDNNVVEIEGVITSVLAGTMFKVALPSGHEVLAHISGKMRKRFIRLVVGDKVKMEMSAYDTSKARIVFRVG
ncbi:translation initiation factor IF-1 [Oceaniferula marina]|uniref:translation initiation factor IF-1 n=1 Tax=Oceaniferula marina TaxID=2748318 RepID=UPI0031BA9A7A